MSGGYDGSIKFDTSIDSRGFNRGLARITSSMAGVQKAIMKNYDSYITSVAKLGAKMLTSVQNSQKLSPAMKQLFSQIITGGAGAAMALGTVVASAAAVVAAVAGIAIAIAAVIAILAAAGVAIFAWAQKFTNTLYKSLSVTSSYRSEVVQLKGAFDTLKGAMMGLGISLLSALAPAIRTVINWLVTAINWASQFIAALSGATTYNKYISGSASGAGQAAKNADKLAKNTDKAGKAAKGALAAFDAINVLQQEAADNSEVKDTSGGGGSGSGGNMVLKAVAIDPAILETVKNVWEWIKQAATDAWNWIVGVWTPIGAWLKTNVIDPIWNSILWLWNIIRDSATELWNGGLQQVLTTFWMFIKGAFVGQLSAGFNMIKNIFKDILVTVSGVIASSIQFFGGLIEFITGIFTGNWKKAWQGIQDMFKGIFNGIVVIVGGVVNTVIDLINGMIAGVIAGVNAVINALNSVSIKIPAMLGKPGYTFGINLASIGTPQIPKLPIPKLATGAVIPPNSQFLAVLGDQKHGTNIETPVGLMEETFTRVMQQNNTQQITVNFTGTMAQLIQAMNPEIKRENTRIGKSLIAGVS